MIIETLVCRLDGTQEIVMQEVQEDYFDAPEPEETENPEEGAGE